MINKDIKETSKAGEVVKINDSYARNILLILFQVLLLKPIDWTRQQIIFLPLHS